MKIAIYYIRARNSMILSCSFEGFLIYIRYSMERGRRRVAGIEEKERKGGRVVKTVIVVIIF